MGAIMRQDKSTDKNYFRSSQQKQLIQGCLAENDDNKQKVWFNYFVEQYTNWS